MATALFAICASRSGFAAAQPAQNQAASGPQFEALPLERSPQNHLLVRALINGKPAILGVDTGAPVSAIAVQRRAHFGVTANPATSKIPTRLSINGQFNSVVIAHRLTLGALNLMDEPLVAVDLGGGNRAGKLLSEPEIDGILGADVLFPTKAIVDCEKGLLILKMDPSVSGTVPGVDYRGLHGVPMHVSSGFNLYVDGTLNGRAARLMVDTGAFTTLIHSSFVRQMRIPLRKTPFSSAGVNLKQRGVQLATISRFSIGPVDMQSKEVGVINLEGLIHGGMLDAKPPVAGLLGSEILSRHHGIIDFGSNTLYLRR
ncbi:MAG: aspartyl protease family protein [Verrucomicrobiota bacterium]|nr:aspartyl protease family protein [Verrucomicrobiota bacterium]